MLLELFKGNLGLVPDGIVGSNTWNALAPAINGYTVHTIRAGDTIFRLAITYNTTVSRIIAANPNINPYALRVGQRVIIPSGDIVAANISYSYDIMQININALKTVYPFLQTGYIGNTVLGKKIPYVRIGTGSREVFYSGAIHANEWITAPLLMKFIENISLRYVEDSSISGYSAKFILDTASIYIVPMVNPDGIDLVTGAIRPGTEVYNKAMRIAGDYPFIPFPNGWKANMRGVDLNLQFPAGWEIAKEIKYEQGFVSPAPRDFVGPSSLSEPESRAMYNFTLAHRFGLILAYHTQGRVIYWRYLDYFPVGSNCLGRQFSNSSGYILEQTPYASAFAGYKDWFIDEFFRPGYTIEAGSGVNPLPISMFDNIYKENEGILVLGAVL
ncbi:MAG: M14 family metallopeptidase [Firmicutes bacterium]|nr:M14 family metallopeptidase [Bacillota bacterium]